MPFIRSISGLRATLGDALTPSAVVEYAAAFAAIQPSGPVVVGRDGRPSGEWIERLVVGALQSCGRHVRIAGVVPTPTVQLLVEHSDAAGGIIITASHNPAEWNGLKFVGADGVFLDAAANDRLWHHVDTHTFSLAPSQETPAPTRIDDAIEQHILRVLALDVVKGAPHSQRERVVVDAVNASGSVIVPKLLDELGYEVVELYCDASGVFPHAPEPVTGNLKDLCAAVTQHKATMGIAVDPDADRLVLIDGSGEPIGEELTIALAAQAVYDAGVCGPAVVNYSTSRTIDDAAAHFGGIVHRSAVGEINVVNRMREVHAVIGGEGSGGVIYPACHMGRDSIVGIGLITSLLRRRGITLAEAVAALPHYVMLKTKIALDDKAQATLAMDKTEATQALDKAAAHFADGHVSREDGVHISWEDKWVHVRASNTEPIMRIIAEAPNMALATELVNTVKDVVQATHDRSN